MGERQLTLSVFNEGDRKVSLKCGPELRTNVISILTEPVIKTLLNLRRTELKRRDPVLAIL